jgi:tetratricopeptide (TPR) repeat protein
MGAGLLPASMSFAADETSAAREHAQKGKAFMDLGKYNEAAAEYEAAYAVKQDPTLLLNLAQAYRMAGNGNKAVFFYRKYLQHVPKSPYRADIEDKIAALEKSGATGAVTPPPAGDNPPTPPPPGPTTPTPPPGPPTGSGPGQPNPPGGASGSPPGAPPPVNPVVAPSTPPPLPPGPQQPAVEAPVDHGKNLRVAGMVTGGAGVLSYVLAAIFAAQAKDAQHNVEKTANAGGTFNPSEDQRGRSAQTKEVTFIIVGTAALAAGGVIYYLGARHPVEAGSPPPGSVALLPTLAPDRAGAALRVTF